METLANLEVVRPQRRSQQLLGRGAKAFPDPGGGQPQRGDTGAQPRCPAVSASTRKVTLTEAGERFLLAIRVNMEGLQAAIASVATDRGEPAGVLKISMGLTFGADYILPLLPAFLARYPDIRPDWRSRPGRSI